jgi:hypothetical protein
MSPVPRRRAERSEPDLAGSAVETATSSPETSTEETSSAATAPTNGVTSSASTPAVSPVAGSAAGESAEDDTEPAAEAPRRGRPRKQSTARKTRTVELILTVTGTAEGEWQAELTHSGKRVVQGLAVSAAAVSRAAKELHPDISGGIESVITAAREQHQARMQELEAELSKVKQALAELED